jgi:hypothetical protein
MLGGKLFKRATHPSSISAGNVTSCARATAVVNRADRGQPSGCGERGVRTQSDQLVPQRSAHVFGYFGTEPATPAALGEVGGHVDDMSLV